MSTTPDLLRPFWSASSDAQEADSSHQQPLDFVNPQDNLYAFGKLWASYDDKPVYSAFHGLMFAMVGTQRLKPLFGYTGFGNFQAKVLADGNIRLRGKEVG